MASYFIFTFISVFQSGYLTSILNNLSQIKPVSAPPLKLYKIITHHSTRFFQWWCHMPGTFFFSVSDAILPLVLHASKSGASLFFSCFPQIPGTQKMPFNDIPSGQAYCFTLMNAFINPFLLANLTSVPLVCNTFYKKWSRYSSKKAGYLLWFAMVSPISCQWCILPY